MTRPARSASADRAPATPPRSTAAPASSVKPRAKRAAATEPPPAPAREPAPRMRTEPPARPSVPPPSAPPPSHGQRPSRAPLPGGYVAPPFPTTPAPDFKVGDKAVHPAHGVGEVTAIEEREIGGTKTTFYILRILDNGMKVMVPTSAATQVGLRSIMSDTEADGILSTMRAREVAVDVQPWSRRFRVYTEMIKSGSAIEIAKVLRDMNRLKFDKELSFGERRLLDQARSLLLKELAFAKKTTEAEMAEEIKRIFST
jgi:CarD family transcriptional regulator